MPKNFKAVCSVAVVSLAFSATAATAAETTSSGDVIATGTSSLSMSLPTAVSLGVIIPGQATTFSPIGIATVTPSGSWSMTVSDQTASPGILKKDPIAVNPLCSSGAANLGSALTFSSTPAVAGGTATGTLGSTASALVPAASSLSDTVTVTYTQPALGSTVQIAAGCTYRTTATYTLTG